MNSIRSVLLPMRPDSMTIVSDYEYESLTALAEEMEHRDVLTPEEDVLLELLVTLI